MKAHTDNVTVLRDASGNPAFVIMPAEDYEKLVGKKEADYIPSEVVELLFLKKLPIARAWREYLGLSQADVAQQMGITQSAYSRLESRKMHRKTTRAKIAQALGIFEEQLDAE